MCPGDPGSMLPRLNSRTPAWPARFRDSTTFAANGRSFKRHQERLDAGGQRLDGGLRRQMAQCREFRAPDAAESERRRAAPGPSGEAVALSAPTARDAGLARLRGTAAASGPARRLLTSMCRFLAIVFCGLS